ncbi:TetR/AcrR family transcriptional regulator [Conyzicola nivalis]|uniref:TetR family transcriptional regulator n=1 Tax=Conyzicola nivalis TaxID=1477021 RepID=A0A916WIM6_9MICO|nr:TetR/AcrR family transcriptional regulator [Conyzicola nivalis]GGB04661.1 TetR family transcriptional regulator [Conyzicola nivalis]
MSASSRASVPPRQHLLEVASELFYREGINSVGIDQIVREAQVTRATLYRHFAGKEALVVAYLQREDAMLRSLFEQGEVAAVSPEHMLESALEGIADDATRHHTRGCPFINATAEFPDPESPVRKVVADHRAWFRGSLARYLSDAGIADPAETVDAIAILRDGVLIGSYLDDSARARRAFLRTARPLAGLS